MSRAVAGDLTGEEVPWYSMRHSTPAVDLSKRLLRQAGYDPDALVRTNGGKFNAEFELILRTLAYIGSRKVDDYGNFRLEDIRNWDRETWGAYWDIQRKFGRLENQLANTATRSVDDPAALAPVPSVTEIMESLSDMAVYCVRMIQILRRLEEKEMIPR